jgi:hypothetical protein
MWKGVMRLVLVCSCCPTYTSSYTNPCNSSPPDAGQHRQQAGEGAHGPRRFRLGRRPRAPERLRMLQCLGRAPLLYPAAASTLRTPRVNPKIIDPKPWIPDAQALKQMRNAIPLNLNQESKFPRPKKTNICSAVLRVDNVRAQDFYFLHIVARTRDLGTFELRDTEPWTPHQVRVRPDHHRAVWCRRAKKY